MNSRGFSLPLLLFLLLTVSVLGFYIYRTFYPNLSINKLPEKTLSEIQKPTDYVKVTGSLELLPTDLQIMKLPPDIIPEQIEEEKARINATKYYKAGIYESGPYKGYTRIIALRPENNMQGFSEYIFATKDFKTYIYNADLTPEEEKKLPVDLTYGDRLYGIDLDKIDKYDVLPQTTPNMLMLSDVYGLHKDRWDATLIEKPSYEDLNTLKLLTISKNFKELPSPNKDFRLFTKVDPNPPKELVKYVSGETTGIYLADGAGVIYKYSQTTGKANEDFPSKLENAENQQEDYYQKMREINGRIEKYKSETGKDDLEINDYPSMPETIYTPSFSFKVNEIKDVILSSGSFYESYENAFPHPCGHDVNTYLTQNIQDPELQKIGTVNGLNIYLLIDANHPIYKIAYELKKKPNDELWEQMDQKEDQYFRRIPDFTAYQAKRPLLFIKDFWGRTALLQENNFTVVGGCGKPVIYLYPGVPTDISLQFTAPMELTTQIPKYVEGWKVKAYPNGKLVDLQPQYTKCELLKNSFGSEYAKSSCERNEYPYIYWAGQSHAAFYPKISAGWIVESREVESTLREKLTEIGLTEKEQNDMLEYWLPQINKYNAPYYRLSLLQNAELNKLFPMQVTPKPDSIIRVFLDFDPLNSAGEISLTVGKVQHYSRNGFTLVEWGGRRH